MCKHYALTEVNESSIHCFAYGRSSSAVRSVSSLGNSFSVDSAAGLFLLSAGALLGRCLEMRLGIGYSVLYPCLMCKFLLLKNYYYKTTIHNYLQFYYFT